MSEDYIEMITTTCGEADHKWKLLSCSVCQGRWQE